MLRSAELEQLRQRKELLVLESDTRRMLLTAEFQRLRTPDFWLGKAGNTALRHPVWTAALGVGAGLLAIRFLRRPAAVVGRLGRWGGAASTALAIWKFLDQTRRRP